MYVSPFTETQHITADSCTLIDHFWTNNSESVSIIDTFVGVSDHLGIAIVINNGEIRNTEQTITYRNMKHFDPGSFAQDISTASWSSCFIFDDVNDQYAHFCALLNQIIEEHAPLKTVKVKLNKSDLPWITPEIKGMIRTKNLLKKQSHADPKLVIVFKDIRRSVKKIAKASRK